MDDLACGIDIERVDAMPVTDDYWEHEFYKESFSKDEIAYCLLQENPRMHFAARWCAKEALVKCDPPSKANRFLQWKSFAISRERYRSPIMRMETSTEPSHARQYFAHGNHCGSRCREKTK